MNRLNITSILASITTERDEKMQQLVTRLSDGKKRLSALLRYVLNPP